MCNDKGYCWASNDYFADLYNTSHRTVIRWINELIDKGYVTRRVDYDPITKQVTKRCLGVVTEMSPPSDKNVTTPSDKNVTENNTYLNNTKNNKYIVEQDSTPYAEIIDYLNKKTNQHYQSRTKATRKHIRARFSEGFTLEDFKTVIDKMSAEWGQDPKMYAYLRPETLFGTKFESYLNRPSKPKELGKYQEDFDAERRAAYNAVTIM